MALPANQTSIIKGAGGGDYTTLAAWAIDLRSAVVSIDYTALIFDTTADTSTIDFAYITLSFDYDITLTVAAYSGRETEAKLTEILNCSIDAYGVGTRDHHFLFKFITFEAGYFSLAGRALDLTIQYCRFFSSVDPYSILLNYSPEGSGNHDVTIFGCLFNNTSNQVALYNTNVNCSIYNCTFVRGGYGGPIAVYGNFILIMNCISIGATVTCYYGTTGVVFYSYAGDNTLSGTTNYNYVSSLIFVDYANHDYRLSGYYYHTGFYLGDNLDLLMHPYLNPPSRGAYQLYSFVDCTLPELELSKYNTQIFSEGYYYLDTKELELSSQNPFVAVGNTYNIDSKNLTLVSYNADIALTIIFPINTVNLELTKFNPAVRYAGELYITTGYLNLTSYNILLLQEEKFFLETKELELEKLPLYAGYVTTRDISLALMEILSYPLDIKYNKEFHLLTKNLDLESENALITVNIIVNGLTSYLELDSLNVQILFNYPVECTLAELNLIPYDIDLQGGYIVYVTLANITLESNNIQISAIPLNRIMFVNKEERNIIVPLIQDRLYIVK